MTSIFLDPDGTNSDWLVLLVPSGTGIRYEHQCAGVGCERRGAEGFLVLLGGARTIGKEGRIETRALTAVFHRGRACVWSWNGTSLPSDRLRRLRAEIAAIPCWSGDDRVALALDEDRLDSVVEAWIPVRSPYGPAFLIWPNCD